MNIYILIQLVLFGLQLLTLKVYESLYPVQWCWRRHTSFILFIHLSICLSVYGYLETIPYHERKFYCMHNLGEVHGWHLSISAWYHTEYAYMADVTYINCIFFKSIFGLEWSHVLLNSNICIFPKILHIAESTQFVPMIVCCPNDNFNCFHRHSTRVWCICSLNQDSGLDWISGSWPTRQIWGIWKLRTTYSPETPNLGQNWWCFVPCDLEIWWMTLENNRASLLCCFKLSATFHSHWWIQTGVTVRKRTIWVKFDDF